MDLRQKALRPAGRVFEFDPDLRGGDGFGVARDVLDSGRALAKMNEIVAAQGKPPGVPKPGQLRFDVRASADGYVTGIDNLQLARIGRLAGAPMDKSAGIDIFKKIGEARAQGPAAVSRVLGVSRGPRFRARACEEVHWLRERPAPGRCGRVRRVLMLLGFPEYGPQAARLAERLGLRHAALDVHRFPDGESRVTLPATLPERVLVCRSLDRPNDKVIELLLTAEGALELGARPLTPVAPDLCNMRQDIAFHPGEAVSQHIVGRFLARCFRVRGDGGSAPASHGAVVRCGAGEA
ncbi:MAG TPA: ribose-phosphate pyrophosphokinase-like domain-containing protein [Burkholderiales bacterium]|nr:ribose-phosphate pyrophosphokinase-like domain-containing protein [Burkholderiales bacterium]